MSENSERRMPTITSNPAALIHLNNQPCGPNVLKEELEQRFLLSKPSSRKNVAQDELGSSDSRRIFGLPAVGQIIYRYLVALLATIVTAGIFSFYLHEYVETPWYISVTVGLSLSVTISSIITWNLFSLNVYLLTIPELFSQMLRIYIVQVSLLFSPLHQIQLNMKTFIATYSCTFDLALTSSQESTERQMKAAIEAGRQLASTISSVSDDIQTDVGVPLNALQTPFNAMNDWSTTVRNFEDTCSGSINQALEACNSAIPDFDSLCRSKLRGRRSVFDKIGNVFNNIGSQVSQGVNQGIDVIKDGVNTGLHETVNAANSGVQEIQNGLQKACSSLNYVNPCDVLKADVCPAFEHLSKPGVAVEFLKDQLDKTKDVFLFDLNFNSNYNSTVSNDAMQNIKDEVNQVLDTLEPYLFCKTLFSYIIIISFFHILLSKIVLVWKHSKGKKVECSGVSVLSLISNPITVQTVILFVLLLIDVTLRTLHETQQNVFNESTFNTSSEFSLNITQSGGTVGQLIADAIAKSFRFEKSHQESIQLRKCYEQELLGASYYEYICVLAGFGIAFSTYLIDILCRKYNKSILVQAKNIWPLQHKTRQNTGLCLT